MPEKLRQLQDLFLVEAAKYNVLPLDDRVAERFNAALAGRPDLQGDRRSMRLGPDMSHLTENTVLNTKNRSHAISAELVVPEVGANGVIAVQGGRFAGWALYVKDGVLKYCYNWLDAEHYFVAAEAPLPTGTVTVQYQFEFDGGTPGAGGNGRLIVNGESAGEARIEKTIPFLFSADETLDIGKDTASPVTDDYPGPGENVFNGTINWVQIDLGDDDVSGLQDPEQVYHRILARQ